MTSRTLTLTVLAAGFLASAAEAAPPPGPPWPVNYARGKVRSANEAPANDFAAADINRTTGGPIGTAVDLRAAIAKPKMGQEYELRYQFRIHTKKGEVGPLLGTTDLPNGASFTVSRVKCEYDWIEFYDTIDITRKELNGMTNMPVPRKGTANDVFIRVEPHLYDVTAKKYVTPARTPAAIVVASVAGNGRVWSVCSLAEWIAEKGVSVDGAQQVMSTLADLDEYSTIANHIEGAFAKVLDSKSAPDAAKLLFINAVEGKKLTWKSHYELRQSLATLAAGPEGKLQFSAKKKLEETK